MTDELDLLDNGVNPKQFSGKRPQFLQVLCILTFVGAGLGLIYSFFQMFLVSSMEGLFTAIDVNPSDGDNEFFDVYRWMKLAVYAGIIGNVLCLAGAIVMWNLRKVGYYIYVLGQALPLLITILTFFSVSGGMPGGFGMFGIIGSVFMALFPVAFIVMYGLNLKYLR